MDHSAQAEKSYGHCQANLGKGREAVSRDANPGMTSGADVQLSPCERAVLRRSRRLDGNVGSLVEEGLSACNQ